MNLLMEALIVILILAVAFVAFMGVLGQSLKIADRSSRLTDSVSQYELLFFQVDNGFRADVDMEAVVAQGPAQ